jgi:hypothetical protein
MVDKTKWCGDVAGKPKKALPKLVVTDDMVYRNLTFHQFAEHSEYDRFCAEQVKAGHKIYPAARADGTFSVVVYVR